MNEFPAQTVKVYAHKKMKPPREKNADVASGILRNNVPNITAWSTNVLNRHVSVGALDENKRNTWLIVLAPCSSPGGSEPAEALRLSLALGLKSYTGSAVQR